MTEGTRYQSSIDEWAELINAPEEAEEDTDVYAKPRKDHNSMANMYKEIPDKSLETHKLGSVYYLFSGLATMYTIEAHIVAQVRRSQDDQRPLHQLASNV